MLYLYDKASTKIISIILAVVFFCAGIGYPADALRVPIEDNKDRFFEAVKRQRLIAEVEPIYNLPRLPITSEADIKRIVEEPLQKAVWILFTKGITTIWTSANKRDLQTGYATMIIRGLSDENQDTLRYIKQHADTYGVRVIGDIDNREVMIAVHVDSLTTVLEVERKMVDVAQAFKPQTISSLVEKIRHQAGRLETDSSI